MTTDWESRYRSGETPWCKGRAHPLLAGVIDRLLPAGFTGRIVVPGCGRGWDLAAIATARPGASVVGIDISTTALADLDRHLSARDGVELIHGDFLDSTWLAERVGPADFLWEHTCFCAIDPDRRSDYAQSAATILQPDGWLAGAFFLNLDDEGDGPPWNCPTHELNRNFQSAFEILECEQITETFDGREGEESFVCMRRRGG